MAEFNESQNPLFEILEALQTVNLDIFDNEIENEQSKRIVERGLPREESSRRGEIKNRLISNQKKKSFIQKIDSLKVIIQQRDEDKGIRILASLINEMLTPKQRGIFMMELNGSNLPIENPEYIGFPNEFQYLNHPILGKTLISRSGEPHNSILQGDVLDSISIREDDNSLKLPIEVKYNQSEAYLIQKGITYCRILLKNFNESSNNTMLRELKSKEVLNVVISEQIKNEKDYITILVDTFPRSLEEIKFILKEDNDIILKSSIFANMSLKNIRNLYQLLVELSNIIDKNILSRACDQSEVNGITVASSLKQNLPPDIRIFADKITRFLNRYKQGVSF